MSKSSKPDHLPEEAEQLISTLKSRFEKNMNRHIGLDWVKIESKLKSNDEKLGALYEMEHSGGEPDVVGVESKTGEYLFYDCSTESPKERRSICYDKKGWESRKENRPKGNAVDMAAEMGIEILTEEEYRNLQKLGDFDTKTSSWLKTPEAIRKFGGSIFGDRRYHHVFIYHNGAQSYYAGRGFRGVVRV
ncbi:DUF4256 domain-containing protein [Cryomorpha ignava]|uniref:DUF4256 domain-containing protein n=1 Tax=Cryomorpha ignava TaxID=101383 RepID=A0A7K3WTL1_9FLAO|nr:DUF4256 domain-containing protein [Cryomorpha ignava]NEN25033.1 DUF4256 domain-containing protein [Cryomorpha ignava]